jgi:nicotinate phosphoribosyltransferase
VFSLFVRRLPTCRNLLLACELSSVVMHLERLRFTADDLEHLKTNSQPKHISSSTPAWARLRRV